MFLGFSPVCCHYMIMGDVTKLHRCNWILASFISASPDVKKQAEEKEMMSYMNINFIYANQFMKVHEKFMKTLKTFNIYLIKKFILFYFLLKLAELVNYYGMFMNVHERS